MHLYWGRLGHGDVKDLGQKCRHAHIEVLNLCIEGVESMDVCTFVQWSEYFNRDVRKYVLIGCSMWHAVGRGGG